MRFRSLEREVNALRRKVLPASSGQPKYERIVVDPLNEACTWGRLRTMVRGVCERGLRPVVRRIVDPDPALASGATPCRTKLADESSKRVESTPLSLPVPRFDTPVADMKRWTLVELHARASQRISSVERLAIEAELHRRELASRAAPLPPPDREELERRLRADYESDKSAIYSARKH